MADLHAAGRALGLEVRSDFPLRVLPGPAPASGSRTLSVRAVDRLPKRAAGEAERLVERRTPEGELFLAVDHHPDVGYRIEAPGFGELLLACDGKEVLSEVPSTNGVEWSRLFFAQVLPCAAALQGLEVLHASAVSLPGGVTAFAGAPGQGKSSLSAQLVARGAGFVTDDVVALEHAGEEVLAHPGPAFASVADEELDAMSDSHRGRLGPELGRGEKVYVGPRPLPQPLPLRRLCYLVRDRSEGGPVLEALDPPDPRLLLASTFVSHLPDRQRLEAQLELCAQLARLVPCVRLVVPGGTSAATTAEWLLREGA